VNLVKSPLKLDPSEGTQFQNAELRPDAAIGGEDVLCKRGGFAALTSALAGSVIGFINWSVKTTFTRTLYIARGTATSATFATYDGSTLATTTTPLVHASFLQYVDENNVLDARRIAAFRGLLIYAGNAYTKGTDNAPIVSFDGTTAYTITSAPPSPEAGTNQVYAIVDALAANGKIYLAVHEQGDAAPDNSGRVLSLDIESGEMQQVCEPFGTGAGTQQSKGAPSCLAWYQGHLWVGQNHENNTDGIGKISRCIPGVSTTWIADVSDLTGSVSSLAVYNGALYAGTQSSVSAAEKVYVRSLTANTWSASFTGVGAAGAGHVTSLCVYGSNLYALQYHSTAPTIHIKKWDGSSWTTDRDLDASDSAVAGLLPGSMVTFGSDLYAVIRASSATATDGFIMKLSSGTWSKLSTGNYAGGLAVLTTRA